MNKANERQYPYWALAVFLPFFSFLVLFMSAPDHVLLKCGRANHMCTLEKRRFFSSESTNIPLQFIRYAHYDKFGFFVKGYNGPELKLQDGNDIDIGTGNTPFKSKEEKTVKEINEFLSNPEQQNLSIAQNSIPSVYGAGLLFLGGLFSLYKALKPYVIQGLRNQ